MRKLLTDEIEFVCEPMRFAPEPTPETVEKMVYKSNDDAEPRVSNLPPRIKALFTIKPFENEFMAFVELYDTIKKDILGYGNILHGLNSMPYAELKAKIEGYTYMSEIKKDFDII